MPTYEMPMLIRVLSQPQLKNIIIRSAHAIFNRGGLIRKIENWGRKELPCWITMDGKRHTEAEHIMISFDLPPRLVADLNDEYLRDTNILRTRIFKKEEISPTPCTLHEELLPPYYRPEVQEMLAAIKKQEDKHNRKKFKHNSGFSYYPFHK